MSTVLGLLFSLLWSSAAIATKFGLASTTPLALAAFRFLSAGLLLLLYVYVFHRNYSWPRSRHWLPLIGLGLLNTTIYLGATFWALNDVSAGLFNLFVATNPLLVAVLSYIWLKRSISIKEWLGMLVAAIGLWIAAWPSIAIGEASMSGLIILGIGMLAMAVGSVYFKKVDLELPGIVINTWQLCIGGILTLPLAYVLEKDTFFFKPDIHFLGSLLWLVFIISIGTMLLWFFLLKRDPVKANNWLFMTPIFGFILAAIFLQETITLFDKAATVVVVIGLFLSGSVKKFSRK
ncbi:DMT family transporter [Paenibacillus spongiae]|uniref:DMT family transporter n=1 Tax=Paenibacillus spongiae TaxID=2909671 RepID=A0ABY5SL71_9BACL|nr:DMT family transporter [Paenibacillus spongiae]UVI33415.1 DMT family transporter [Paenibacillus spongiae]